MKLLRENLEIQRRRFGTDHQLALRAASQLVIALQNSQTDADLAEAESLARESSELWVRRYGPEFPETLCALAELGQILATRGKLEEARSVLAPLPDAFARVFGPDHFQRDAVLRNYGVVLEAAGDLNGAVAQYRQSLVIHSKGLAGRRDRDQLEAVLPHLPGPRRADPRPRRRRRDVPPADPGDAREDPAPPRAGRPPRRRRSPTRWPSGATRRPPSSSSRRCTTTPPA